MSINECLFSEKALEKTQNCGIFDTVCMNVHLFTSLYRTAISFQYVRAY